MDSATHDLMREGEDVYGLAQQDGLLQAAQYLAGLSGNYADVYADGFADAANLVERMVTDARAGQDRYTLEQAPYDTSQLLAAAAAIRAVGIPQGISDAIEAIREFHDGEAESDDGDYLAGVAAAAAALVDKYGVNPDPTWKPGT